MKNVICAVLLCAGLFGATQGWGQEGNGFEAVASNPGKWNGPVAICFAIADLYGLSHGECVIILQGRTENPACDGWFREFDAEDRAINDERECGNPKE